MTTTCLIMLLKSSFTYWLAMAQRRQRLRRKLWDLPCGVTRYVEKNNDCPKRREKEICS